MSVIWGLDLSATAVRLMHRSGDIWREEGREPLDGDDLEERLKRLAERVAQPDNVNVFLPKDQILYTNIELADLSNARAEIEAAMDGRTPYSLSEISLDWDINDDSIAHVAAMAHETMEEAATFVRGLGLRPVNFSSIAEAGDFPRNPNFGSLEELRPTPLVLTESDVPPSPFVSARPTSEPGAESASGDQATNLAEPVIRVEDATPVMSVSSPTAKPLDPGAPVAKPDGPPRIRTDVGAAVARGRAESLTAPPPIKIRERDRAFPTPLLAGIAAAMCLGIAAIIWSIFPNSTGSIPLPPAQPDTLSEQTTGEVTAPDVVADEAQEDSVAAVLPQELSDTPPDATISDFAITAPSIDTDPTLPSALEATHPSEVPGLGMTVAELQPGITPNLGAPREPRPAQLAGIENQIPEGFRLAALPATPQSPSNTRPGATTYPGSAITTPLANATPALPDEAVPTEIAALPPELVEQTQQDTPTAALDDTPAADAEPADTVEEIEVGTEAALDDESPERQEDFAEQPSETTTSATTEDLAALESPALAEETDEVAAAALPAEVAPDVEEAPQGLPEPEEQLAAPGQTLNPTELARSVPDRAPPVRPQGFSERLERQRFGGLSLAELAQRNPPDRPNSEQVEALLALTSRDASELAIESSAPPRSKPENFDSIVASTQVQQQTERRAEAIASNTPDTSAAIEAALAEELEDEEATSPRNSPRLSIPSSASVSRQATIDDAIRLNRINLIGVYGAPSDRRALIRLSSGRYVKVKVGDRVDGGTVSAITASQVQYQKGSRTLSLSVPEG